MTVGELKKFLEAHPEITEDTEIYITDEDVYIKLGPGRFSMDYSYEQKNIMRVRAFRD